MAQTLILTSQKEDHITLARLASKFDPPGIKLLHRD
jgi:hypothetical protein